VLGQQVKLALERYHFGVVLSSAIAVLVHPAEIALRQRTS
jgi:hypothetical protein